MVEGDNTPKVMGQWSSNTRGLIRAEERIKMEQAVVEDHQQTKTNKLKSRSPVSNLGFENR
jgi:hypothetical protein